MRGRRRADRRRRPPRTAVFDSLTDVSYYARPHVLTGLDSARAVRETRSTGSRPRHAV